MSRRGGSGRRGGGGGSRAAAAEPEAVSAPADARTVLEAVQANPVQLQGAHVVLRDLIEKAVEGTAQPGLRQQMTEAFSTMLQGKGPSFSMLQGGPLAPLANLSVEEQGVVLEPAAWSQEGIFNCLAEIAQGNIVAEEIPPPIDTTDALLTEMNAPMEADQLQATFETLNSYRDSTSQVGTVIRMLVQLAQLDGPLRMFGGMPSPCDLQTFSQHLSALANQLNTLHDPKLLGEYLQSPFFKREKYELFALQHVQMLVWLHRVQQGMQQGVGKTGQELQQFVMQISHAARVLLFQPMLLHGVQVMRYVHSLPTEEVTGSMRQAMMYPPDTATDADRVEWLQLNLLLQFQTVYRDALCNTSIYQMTYSHGEAQLFQGFLRLEEIYTHLIGRFPACCPLTEQEQAVLTQLCTKLNKYFQDGKQIKSVLEQQPQQGKQLLVANRLATNAQFSVRDWILPFMMLFTDLLKVLWTLWTQLKRRQQLQDNQRRGVEQLARIVGELIVGQLAEEARALEQMAIPAAPPPVEFANGRVQQLPQALPQPLAQGQARVVGEPVVSMEMNGPPLDAADSGGVGWASVVRRPPTEAPNPGPAAVKPKPVVASAASKPAPTGTSEEQLRALVSKREQARFARDFESADRLRDQLAKLGVSVDDQSKVWRSGDGRSGPITPVNVSELHAQKAAKAGAASLSDDEIGKLVRDREQARLQARYTGDYKAADKLRDHLEKHGVHVDPKTSKWQSADGRSGPIGSVTVSASHAQKATRTGAPQLPLDEIEKILVQREQARARRDYKTADVLRDQLEKHGVFLDSKARGGEEKKWHATDGRTGAILVSSLSDEEIGKILANRQAARLRHDYKSADRLRDQLNEQCVSVDDKKNRWDASDGRAGVIEPFTCVHSAPKGDADSPAAATAKDETTSTAPTGTAKSEAVAKGEALPSPGATKGGDGKREKVRSEKEARRELAKRLRDVTGASARLCEKALASHGDDMDRAAEWLLLQGEQKGDAAEVLSANG